MCFSLIFQNFANTPHSLPFAGQPRLIINAIETRFFNFPSSCSVQSALVAVSEVSQVPALIAKIRSLIPIAQNKTRRIIAIARKSLHLVE